MNGKFRFVRQTMVGPMKAFVRCIIRIIRTYAATRWTHTPLMVSRSWPGVRIPYYGPITEDPTWTLTILTSVQSYCAMMPTSARRYPKSFSLLVLWIALVTHLQPRNMFGSDSVFEPGTTIIIAWITERSAVTVPCYAGHSSTCWLVNRIPITQASFFMI